ncbi:MAG: sugar ABC transporter permease [Anaerolineae bacterium]|nr:sugar ABC transporter permease [Anaerolineae bacterium]
MPWVVGFLIFTLFPIAASFYLSFTEYRLFTPPKWIGTENYNRLFTLSAGALESAEQRSSEVLAPRHQEIVRVQIGNGGFAIGAREADFWRSVRLTLLYGLITVPLGLFGALAVALLLNQRVKALGFWRVLFYMPAILPAVATALLWRWIFSPQSGLLNGVLSPLFNLFGIDPPRWFSDPNLVMPALVIMSLWGVFGANTVILLAGLKGIPTELYEAADIDGANNLVKFWRVTIPMLSPALFYNLVTGTIAAIQGGFEIAAFIPIPASSGTFLNWLIYQQAFNYRQMGMASAMGWLTLLLILVLTLLIFRSSQAWVFYQGAREGK